MASSAALSLALDLGPPFVAARAWLSVSAASSDHRELGPRPSTPSNTVLYVHPCGHRHGKLPTCWSTLGVGEKKLCAMSGSIFCYLSFFFSHKYPIFHFSVLRITPFAEVRRRHVVQNKQKGCKHVPTKLTSKIKK
jgi:hypothetical protein